MNFSEAKQVVQQVKNRYQAFEKLEEVLATAASLENAIKHMEDTNAKLRIEDEELVEQQKKLKAAIKRDAERAKENAAALQRELADKTAATRKLLQEAKQDFDAFQRTTEDNLKTAKEAHDREVAERKRYISELTNTEERLRKSIASLKARVEKVEV